MKASARVAVLAVIMVLLSSTIVLCTAVDDSSDGLSFTVPNDFTTEIHITETKPLPSTLETGTKYILDINYVISSAVVVTGSSCLDLNGYSLTRNSAGSVISVSAGGSLVIMDSLTGGTITHATGVEGAGIEIASASESTVCGTLYLTGGSVSNNKNSADGGGIINRGSLYFTGGSVQGNTSSGYGGGVFNADYSTFIMTGGMIGGDPSKVLASMDPKGSGIETPISNLIAADSKYYLTTSNGGAFDDNSGGGIITLSAMGNKAKSGGGLYFGTGCTVEIKGSTIRGNHAVTGGSGTDAGGGGIYSSSDLKVEDSRVDFNESDSCGGGILINKNITASIIGTNVDYNLLTNNGSAGSGCNGAGLFANGGVKVTFDGSTVSHNYCQRTAGGFEAMTGSTITIRNSHVDYNVVKCAGGYGGGGFTLYGNTVILDSGSVSYNYTTGVGGAMYKIVDSGSEKVINNGVDMIGNVAYEGGAVYANCEYVQNAGNLEGNKATNGGAIYCKASVTVSGGSISKNQASVGGGIYVGSGSFTMNGGSISENKSTGQGGGIFCSGSVVISDGTVTGNVASSGGGIYMSSGSFTMGGGSITSNKATGSGEVVGGIQTAGTAVLNGGVIGNNIVDDSSSVTDMVVDGSFTLNGANIQTNNLDGNRTVIKIASTALFNKGILGYNLDSEGNNLATIYVSGTMKVVYADIVGCEINIGPEAFLFCSSNNHLSDGSVTGVSGTHKLIKQYYTKDTLHAFVYAPSGSSNTLQYTIAADVLSASGLTDVSKWYSVWEGQNNSNVISLDTVINSGTVINGFTMYSIKFDMTYTIVLNSNGGSGSVDDIRITDTSLMLYWDQTERALYLKNGNDIERTISVEAFSKVGYALSGWNVNIPANGLLVSTLLNGKMSVTLAAVWLEVKYDLNGGTGSIGSDAWENAGKYTCRTYDGSKDSCVFAGWYVSDGNNRVYYPTGSALSLKGFTGSVTIYANWIVPDYSATLIIGGS